MRTNMTMMVRRSVLVPAAMVGVLGVAASVWGAALEGAPSSRADAIGRVCLLVDDGLGRDRRGRERHAAGCLSCGRAIDHPRHASRRAAARARPDVRGHRAPVGRAGGAQRLRHPGVGLRDGVEIV